ncbi:hypothetical protein GCM10027402_08140 [Arthrobacter monumenti]
MNLKEVLDQSGTDVWLVDQGDQNRVRTLSDAGTPNCRNAGLEGRGHSGGPIRVFHNGAAVEPALGANSCCFGTQDDDDIVAPAVEKCACYVLKERSTVVREEGFRAAPQPAAVARGQ